MRDWAPIRGLFVQLDDEKTAATARSALVAFAGRDLGADKRAWHEALRELLREDLFEALGEMGLLDDEVVASYGEDRVALHSLNLAGEIRHALANGRAKAIWLPNRPEWYGGDQFRHDLVRVTGSRPTVKEIGDARGLGLNGHAVTLKTQGEQLQDDAFAWLQRWASEHAGGRRFVRDASHAFLVDDAQLAAMRKYRAADLFLTDESALDEAQAWLAAAGLVLPRGERHAEGTMRELIRAMFEKSGCGHWVERVDADVNWRALMKMPAEVRRGLPKESPEGFDWYAPRLMIKVLNGELEKNRSLMRLVGIEHPRRTQVFFVPLDRVQPLTEAKIIDYGTEAARPNVERTVSSYTPPGVQLPRPADVIPEARRWIGDGECVDSAADYLPLVQALAALAGLELEAVSCEEAGATRRLSFQRGDRRFQAQLRGNTDYADPPPLLACLNEAAEDAGLSMRFCQFEDPSWGQEFGVAFASPEEQVQLRELGALVEAAVPEPAQKPASQKKPPPKKKPTTKGKPAKKKPAKKKAPAKRPRRR